MDVRARRHLLTGLAGLGVIGAGIWSSGALEVPEPPPEPTTRILAVERRATAPLPPALPGSPTGNRVPFDVRLRRTDLAVLARQAGAFVLEVYRCSGAGRTHVTADIFLEGAPLRRHAGEGRMSGNAREFLEREAAAAAKGPEATLRAVILRHYVDNEWPTCVRFATMGSVDAPLTAPARLPPPGEADLAALGIVPELVTRPAGLDNEAFAERLVAAEAERRRLPPRIWQADLEPIGSRESEPGHGRTIVVYFAVGAPADRPGKVCRLNAARGGLNRLKPIAYPLCAGLLGIAPAAKPPSVGLITHFPANEGAPPPIPPPPPPPNEEG